MYEINKKNHYYVLDRNNQFYKFETYEKLLRWLERHRIFYRFKEMEGRIDRVGNNWNDSCSVTKTDNWPYFYREKQLVDFIVFDAYNRVVNVEYLRKDVEDLEPRKYCGWRWRRIEKNWLGFRSGPVPHTGYGNKAGGHYYRRPRTTQELRRNSWDKKYARKKRCRKLLPDAWDDLYSSGHGKSWKRQKKRKQWM